MWPSFQLWKKAEALAKKCNADVGNESHWLARHTTLVPEVISTVQQFAMGDPQPVLFLEPGDLILYNEWVAEMHDSAVSCCVLRRRQEAS